jgi:hypothetical protein
MVHEVKLKCCGLDETYGVKFLVEGGDYRGVVFAVRDLKFPFLSSVEFLRKRFKIFQPSCMITIYDGVHVSDYDDFYCYILSKIAEKMNGEEYDV